MTGAAIDRDWRTNPLPGDWIQERDKRVNVARRIEAIDGSFVYMEYPKTRIRRSNLKRYELVRTEN